MAMPDLWCARGPEVRGPRGVTAIADAVNGQSVGSS